jgi:hypothetical protein
MFHVPEFARDQTHPIYRSTAVDGNNGAFHLVSPEPGWRLAVLASDGDGWEHVSVHAYKRGGRRQRTPSWREMTFIKDQFWDDEDVVIQFHPRRSEYVNLHPHTLHLWRPTKHMIPTPPAILVGPLALTT